MMGYNIYHHSHRHQSEEGTMGCLLWDYYDTLFIFYLFIFILFLFYFYLFIYLFFFFLGGGMLTDIIRVTHICVSKITLIDSDNGLSPGRHQAIIWSNVEILLIRTIETNFREILIEFHEFSFRKMHLKMLSAKWFKWSRHQYVNTLVPAWLVYNRPHFHRANGAFHWVQYLR